MSLGDVAPSFALESDEGQVVHLHDFWGRPVVLFFYPGDFTSVCTKEAEHFRDSIDAFNAKGAVVLGVSKDPVESHRQFKKEHKLPFTLLSDLTGKVHRKYRVAGSLGGLLKGRKTFVIDKEGIIVHIFESALNWKMHVSEALAHC